MVVDTAGDRKELADDVERLEASVTFFIAS